MYRVHTLLRSLTLLAWLLLATAAQSQPPGEDLLQIPVEDLTPEQAVELFKTLPAPTMEEMNGEFAGEMLSFPTLYTSIFWTIASNNPVYPG
ncbi:MAG: hypothetical protein KDI21_15320, partial [Halieaceae bacterium]|nr:hypothetical protein [Halieaceae bacterium]